MRIVCDNCATKYSIPDDRVRNKPFKIRCKKCSYVIVVQAADAGGEAEEPGWYVVINGEQVGPVAARDVEEYFYAGQVDAETYIWRDGLPDWVPISQTSEFAHVVAAAAAPAAAGGIPEDDDDGATRQVSLGELYGSAAQDQPAQPAEDPYSNMGGPADESEEESTRIMSMDAVGQQMGGVAAAAAAADAGSSFEGFGDMDAPAPQDDEDEDDGGGLFASLGASLEGAGAGGASASAAGDGDFSLSSLSGGGSAEPAPSPRKSGEDLVGARSENSVLFSLSNLQAISAPSKADKGGELPTTEGSGLIDIKALAASQAAAPADTRPAFGGNSGGSDAFEGSVIPVPAMMPMGTRKSNTGLIVGIAATAVVFITLIVVVIVLVMSDDEQPQQQQPVAQQDDEEEEDPIGVGAGGGAAAGGGAIVADAGAANGGAAAAGGTALPGATAAPGPGVADTPPPAEGAAAAGTAADGAAADGANPAEAAASAEADSGDGGSTAEKEEPKEEKKSSRDSKREKKKEEPKEEKKEPKEEKKKEEKKKPSGSSLSKADVQKVIRGSFSKIRTCSRNAEQKGKLNIAFKIKSDGRVSGASIATASFKGTRVGACVVKVVEGMKFPAHGGDPVPVKYPFSIQ